MEGYLSPWHGFPKIFFASMSIQIPNNNERLRSATRWRSVYLPLDDHGWFLLLSNSAHQILKNTKSWRFDKASSLPLNMHVRGRRPEKPFLHLSNVAWEYVWSMVYNATFSAITLLILIKKDEEVTIAWLISDRLWKRRGGRLQVDCI